MRHGYSSAAKRQGILHCLESGHHVIVLTTKYRLDIFCLLVKTCTADRSIRIYFVLSLLFMVNKRWLMHVAITCSCTCYCTDCRVIRSDVRGQRRSVKCRVYRATATWTYRPLLRGVFRKAQTPLVRFVVETLLTSPQQIKPVEFGPKWARRL